MKILAIDTATDACSVALWLDGVVYEDFQIAARQHTTLILPMVQNLLAEANMALSEMEAFAFAAGPGSFTGLRIAASIIQGFAFATRKPIIPVSTLAAIAQGVYREQKTSHVLVALDARMQEIYWGCYAVDEKQVMQAQFADSLGTAATLRLPEHGRWQGVGSGWEIQGEALTARMEKQLIGRPLLESYPYARDVAYLASMAFDTQLVSTAREAIPVYLRDEVAKKNLLQ